MTRRSTLIAGGITALGVLITLFNLRGGLHFSIALLLGVLLIADGVLRFAMLAQERPDHADSR